MTIEDPKRGMPVEWLAGDELRRGLVIEIVPSHDFSMLSGLRCDLRSAVRVLEDGVVPWCIALDMVHPAGSYARKSTLLPCTRCKGSGVVDVAEFILEKTS